MLNQGGEGQILEVLKQFPGPLRSSPVWLCEILHGTVDWERGVQHLLAIRSAFEDTWRASGWGVWWDTWDSLYRTMLRKNRNNVWGTWESNPGPNGYQPRHFPLRHLASFVNVTIKEIKIWKQPLFWKLKKTRAFHLNEPTMYQHAFIFFAFSCKIKSNSGGFKPPQPANVKNSE